MKEAIGIGTTHHGSGSTCGFWKYLGFKSLGFFPLYSPLPFFPLWQTMHNIKLTILTIFRCIVKWHCIHSYCFTTITTPPSTSVTLSSCKTLETWKFQHLETSWRSIPIKQYLPIPLSPQVPLAATIPLPGLYIIDCAKYIIKMESCSICLFLLLAYFPCHVFKVHPIL